MGTLAKPTCHAPAWLNAFAQKATAEVRMPGAQAGGNGIRKVVPLNSFNIFRHAGLRSFPSSLNPVPEDADNSHAFAVHDGKNHFRTKR